MELWIIGLFVLVVAGAVFYWLREDRKQYEADQSAKSGGGGGPKEPA